MESTKEALENQLEKVTEKIKEQNSKFEASFLNGDPDSLSEVFARNVVQYLPHQPPTVGLDSLIKNNKLQMSWGKWKFKLTTIEVKISGQIAIERGSYKLSFTSNENSPIPSSVDTGHYIVLWEELDGIWKIVWDAPVTELPL